MRIRLADRRALDNLVAFLSFDPNAIVEVVGDAEVEVSFLGSLNDEAQWMETELRVRMWMSAHPGAITVVSE